MKQLSKIIEQEYGFPVSRMALLNCGFDQNTTVYKLYSHDQETFFLKIRSGVFSESSLLIPFWLSEKMHLPNLIAPVETKSKRLYVKEDTFYLTVYPYINGRSGWDISLTEGRFFEFGKCMKSLHSTALPEEYSAIVPVETYGSKYRIRVTEYLGSIENKNQDDLIIREFLNFLQMKKKIILKMIHTTEKCVEIIKTKKPGYCLCHGDIHAGNLLINKNTFYIVDWDTILMAPKERDLMFIGGGIGNKWNTEEEIRNFYAGYGDEIKVDQDLIKYYRHERIIQDICEFYHQITGSRTNDEERELCLRLFKEQFEANNVIDMAGKF